MHLADADPNRTVLDWLREDKGLTGTKEGCAEGDCGACAVILVDHQDGALHYRTVNACILFLPQLDGRQLVTIEHLKVKPAVPTPSSRPWSTTTPLSAASARPASSCPLWP